MKRLFSSLFAWDNGRAQGFSTVAPVFVAWERSIYFDFSATIAVLIHYYQDPVTL